MQRTGWLSYAFPAIVLAAFFCSGSKVAAADPVIVAAGDIACDYESTDPDECQQMTVSNLFGGINPTAVLPLGDLQYDDGRYNDFLTYYGPSWGRFKNISYPAAGNHEYQSAGAAGYFQYWGGRAGDPTKGYYHFDLGAWHLIALNSNCYDIGGCEAGSPQEQWLRAVLAAHRPSCILAYWHHPRFGSGIRYGSDTRFTAFWEALYDYGADVVLTGHEHVYERFSPQTPWGDSDPQFGIVEFVVGTGGRILNSFGVPAPNSEVRNSNTFGVLKMTLRDTSYDFQFVPVPGRDFTDSGGETCNFVGAARTAKASLDHFSP